MAYGRASLESARYADAERVLVDFAKRFPDDVGVLGLLTRLHREQGRFEKAVEAPAAPAAPVAFDAKATFGTVCGTCHGLEGKGDGVAAAGLNPKPAAFGDPEFWKTRDEAHIKKVIKEGGAAVGKSPMMAPFGAQFNDEQIAALAAHVMSFKPQ